MTHLRVAVILVCVCVLCLAACRSMSNELVAPPPTAKAVDPAAAPVVVDRCRPPAPHAASARSLDGKTLIYVQVDPTRKDQTVLGDSDHEILCVVVGNAPARLLLEGSGIEDGAVSSTLADLGGLTFSHDGSTLYFTSTGWATSTALHSVNVATGWSRFVTDGALVQEVTTGRFAGWIVVVHDELDPDHGVDSPQYRGRVPIHRLHRPDGTEVQRLPDDPHARRALLETR